MTQERMEYFRSKYIAPQSAAKCRFLYQGQAVNIATGELCSKGSKGPIYSNFDKATANELAMAYGLKAEFRPGSQAGGIGCAALMLLCMAFCAVNHDSPTESAPSSSSIDHDKFGAFFYCQEAVKQQLKAPSTADFGSYGESRIVLIRPGVYSVLTHVDAQNSYGAKLRSVCLCDMQRSTGDSWEAIGVSIQ